MDPSRALSNALGPALLAALRTPASEGQVQALLAQVGQELDLVLFAVGRDSVKLRLPSGQVFEAAGELPYPAGTRLTVQVQAPATEGGAARLKLLEASLPPAPAILAPLLQGEAAPLMARLLQAEVPPSLQPLLRILETLQDPALPQAPPSSRILAALETLPVPALQALRQLAPGPTATLPELAQVFRGWIGSAFRELAAQATIPQAPGSGSGTLSPQQPASSPPAGAIMQQTPPAASPSPASLPSNPVNPPISAPLHLVPPAPTVAPVPQLAGVAPPTGKPEALPQVTTAPESTTVPYGPEGSLGADSGEPSAGPKVLNQPVAIQNKTDLAALLIQRLETQLASRGEPVMEARDPIRALVRQLLKGLEAPPPSMNAQTLAAPANARSRLLAEAPEADHRPLPPLPAAPTPSKGAPPSPPERADAWESWIGGAIRALGDPQTSPREAPFHLAQAREGTAFFELPLPWGSAPLQIWIESGLPEERKERSADANQKVLVGLSFTALGETRVGLQQARGTLQVRIWTERPELLGDRLPDLQRELEGEGSPVDLKVLALGDGQTPVPSLRAVLAGSAFQALG